MPGIEIRGLTKSFLPGEPALEAVDLDVANGELLVLVGPSGSGKTTLLRLVAGLDTPTAGSIRLGGRDLAGVPPHRRNVALVFQNLALYDHLSVAQNLAFGLDGKQAEDQQNTIRQAAAMLGIDSLLERYPAELSGGEQQRVALGRAIVRQPAALLLDEPLSSLDAPVRRGLRRELKRLQRELAVPTIYVTHDQAEALALGDVVAVLDRGRVQQVGTPNDIYHKPANRFVAEFFGPQGMNLIEGALQHEGGRTTFHAGGIEIEPGPAHGKIRTGPVLCGFRPEDVEPASGPLCGRIVTIESLGESQYLHVEMQDQPQTTLIVRQPNTNREHPPDATIHLHIHTDRLHWFDPTTGQRL